MRNSQLVRRDGAETDALWMGSGRTPADLEKAQILIDSSAGDSHPGSRHLHQVADTVKNAVYAAQAMPAVYTVTDICDGVATGHQGMNYSLISRDMIAGMVEIHAMASGFDGLVTISSCDKSIPGHLMAMARLDLPAIHVCGGSMMPGPDFISADSCYEVHLRQAQKTIAPEEAFYVRQNACPSCGACQYMGTASTMQVMSETLGMALPGSAWAAAGTNILSQIAQQAGARIAKMVQEGLRPSQIMTKEAFHNALIVHAAIGGSTNAVLHLPAIARELGITLTLEDFAQAAKGVPLLTSILTAGKWPTQYFYLAGGVPRVMRELKDQLDLDQMTVTGHTLGENLDYLEKTGYFRRSEGFLRNYNLRPEQIIRPVSDPEDVDSGVTILYGNLAPEGAVIKHCAVDKQMYYFEGIARVFQTEEEAVAHIYDGTVQPGDVVVIRYVGKRAAGMPEMLRATDAICNRKDLANTTALITDGRFSGATRGPSVGYLLPEAADGGPIAYIEEGDLIEIDIPNQQVNLVGFEGKRATPQQVKQRLEERKKTTVLIKKERKGVLRYLDL